MRPNADRLKLRLRWEQDSHGKPGDAIRLSIGEHQSNTARRETRVKGGDIGRLWPMGRVFQASGNRHHLLQVRGTHLSHGEFCRNIWVDHRFCPAAVASPKISASDRRR